MSACAHGDVFAAQRSELRDAQPGLDAEQHQGATGDLEAARDAWQEALDILDRLGLGPRAGLGAAYPAPDELRVKLRYLDSGTSYEANDDADHDPRLD